MYNMLEMIIKERHNTHVIDLNKNAKTTWEEELDFDISTNADMTLKFGPALWRGI